MFTLITFRNRQNLFLGLVLSSLLFSACKQTGATITKKPKATLLHDAFDVDNTTLWAKSDGWANSAPFWVGWRLDHVSVAAGKLTLQLDETPCKTNSVACSNQPYASGEYQSKKAFGFASYQTRLKVAKGDGQVTAFFLYTGPNEGTIHDEIDIEFLGKDTTKAQFNYFTDGVGGHEKVVNLGFDSAAAFHDYQITRSSTQLSWYVDGVLKHSVTQSPSNPLPQTPTKVILNLWAGTGVDSWLNRFTYTTPVTAQFDSISITEN